MEQRDRASGWQHAKLSGHSNEERVKILLDNNPNYSNEFLSRIGLPTETIKSTQIGGIHEKNVPSIYDSKPKTTKSKTDLKIACESGKNINISIKKSLSGQVYFVKAQLFVEAFQKQFHKEIPGNVVRAIDLFWSEANDAVAIIEKYANKEEKKNYDLQIRHKSVNATTLKKYDETLYNQMLNWFESHAYELTKLSFSMGAAKEQTEWSDFVWYINLLGENNIDMVFNIERISKAAKIVAKDETYYGETNGGTTIQLPFGFVQWHKGQLQFHHMYEKLCKLHKIGYTL